MRTILLLFGSFVIGSISMCTMIAGGDVKISSPEIIKSVCNPKSQKVE